MMPNSSAYMQDFDAFKAVEFCQRSDTKFFNSVLFVSHAIRLTCVLGDS